MVSDWSVIILELFKEAQVADRTIIVSAIEPIAAALL